MNSKNEKIEAYHHLSAEEVCEIFNSGGNGLSDAQVSVQLKKYGKNLLPKESPHSVFKLFIRQFNNPLTYILLFAMVLSFILKHISDGVIIALVVLVSGLVGFIQEFKANKALSELNSIVKYKTRVVRNGVLSVIDQIDIVPGDLIDICPGDIIPADARLITSHNLKIAESILTGESVPSAKAIDPLPIKTSLADCDNMVFQGTAVGEGAGQAVVVSTGKNTEMGKIASLIAETDDIVTPLQKQVGNFAKWLSFFLVLTNLAIFLIGILLGRPIFEMFMISIIVVVSAVPEGLAPAMSIALALGMQKLIKKRGLVRKIISAETLGAVSVICTDKTGTLTEGEMSVESIVTAERDFKIGKEFAGVALDDAARRILNICVLSNDAVIDDSDNFSAGLCVVGNMTDKSMLIAGDNYGIYRNNLERGEKRLHEIPFSSDQRFMATLHQGQGINMIYAKGAPEKIIIKTQKILIGDKEVDFDEERRASMNTKIFKLTSSGQRVVAVAYCSTKKNKISHADIDNLVLIGLVVIKDKVRADAKEAVALCHKAGVRVVMITGDHANTAKAIAAEVGIKASKKQVITGAEIDELSEAVLSRLNNALVFARVEPRHKLQIVSLLQKSGEVVAMTGDGVNDAPALKKADIGIAMGNGTDVAKEIADLVLLDSSFMTIVEAIKQGRNTFSNIRKVAVYLFTDCFQEMVIIGSAVLFGWPIPITPAQILWIKLIESPLPATSLSFEEPNHDVLLDKPRGRNEQLLTKGIKLNIAFYALVMDVIALSVFYYYWQGTGNIEKTRTLMFVALGMSTLFNIYNVRSLGDSVFRVNPFKNRFLVMATIIGFLLFLLAIYSSFMNKVLDTVPLNLNDWFVIMSYALTSLVVFEVGKNIIKYWTKTRLSQY